MSLEKLRNKLRAKQPRATERFDYYEMKKEDPNFSAVIPPKLRAHHRVVLGWTTKAVDELADRLVFRGFENDLFNFNQIFNMNNPDTLFDSAILSSLITSCNYIYISSGDDGMLKMQVVDDTTATGIIDPVTGLLEDRICEGQRCCTC